MLRSLLVAASIALASGAKVDERDCEGELHQSHDGTTALKATAVSQAMKEVGMNPQQCQCFVTYQNSF